MAWNVTGIPCINLSMAEGDFGVSLPVTISGAALGSQDSVKMTFKTALNGEMILEKNFSGIVENTVNLEFTEAETALFRVGTYVYSLDWYQNGNFMCNIIPIGLFKVVDKV